ncbi:MAG: GAF domain-containing protein [Actinomycetota bacterium]|nr:GAF domain-containing protein [Actinomycetota bacterium]
MPYHQASDPVKRHALMDAAIESDRDLSGVLEQIVASAAELVGARYGALGVLDPAGHGLAEFVHVGMDRPTVEAIGLPPDGHGILGLLIVDPRPLRLGDLRKHRSSVGFPTSHPPMRSFLGVSIRVRGEVQGNLYVADRIGGAEFSAEDERLLVALASTAGIAVDNARLHARVRELTLTEDRERIARDLHDTVIQRVFAVALSLQAVAGVSQEPEIARRLQTAVEDLDETIRQIYTTIFAIGPPPSDRAGLRVQALHICAGAARGLGFEPEIHFTGPIDLVLQDVGTEALATLREALSNVARHAKARRVEVVIACSADELLLEVADDGIGPKGHGSVAGNGLANMAARARTLGGSFSLAARPDGGTSLCWRVPLI